VEGFSVCPFAALKIDTLTLQTDNLKRVTEYLLPCKTFATTEN